MIQTIRLKGTDYPFLFSIRARRESANAPDDADETYFCFLGFKYGALKEGKKFELTQDQLVDLFEDDPKGYEKAVETLAEHLGEQKKITEKVAAAVGVKQS